MNTCPECGKAIDTDGGTCDLCGIPKMELKSSSQDGGSRPRRGWRSFLASAGPDLIEGVIETVTGVVTILNAIEPAGGATGASADNSSKRSARTSALRPGRMRQTDLVKGADGPLPNEPGIVHHVDKATGVRNSVGQADKDLLKNLADGKYDGERSDSETNGVAWGFYIDEGTPVQYREGASTRFFDGRENTRTPGTRTNKRFETEEAKTAFLKRYGFKQDMFGNHPEVMDFSKQHYEDEEKKK